MIDLPELHADLACEYFCDFLADHERYPTETEERELCGRAYRDACAAIAAGEN